MTDTEKLAAARAALLNAARELRAMGRTHAARSALRDAEDAQWDATAATWEGASPSRILQGQVDVALGGLMSAHCAGSRSAREAFRRLR